MNLIATANEPDDTNDSLPELPPLDRGDDDDVPLVEVDGHLIPLDEAAPADPELDEAAIDLDVGVKIDEPTNHGDDVAPQELVLDMSELLNLAEDGEIDEDDGPAGMDPALGIEVPPTTAEDGATEGIEEELDYLVAERLPGLDADEDGLFEVDAGYNLEQGARDDPAPPWADTRWSVVQPAPNALQIDAPRQRSEIPGVAQVVCATSAPELVAIVGRHAQLELAREGADGRFEFRVLDESASRVARGGRPFLVARGPFVCLGDEKQGIAISADGGRTFDPVRGCAGVTAMTLGDLHRTTVVLAALHREAADVTELVCIDVARLDALRVATVEPAREDEPCRISSLIWDEEAHALLAGGDFGSASIFPPRQ